MKSTGNLKRHLGKSIPEIQVSDKNQTFIIYRLIMQRPIKLENENKKGNPKNIVTKLGNENKNGNSYNIVITHFSGGRIAAKRHHKSDKGINFIRPKSSIYINPTEIKLETPSRDRFILGTEIRMRRRVQKQKP